jgi:hypothetical protein
MVNVQMGNSQKLVVIAGTGQNMSTATDNGDPDKGKQITQLLSEGWRVMDLQGSGSTLAGGVWLVLLSK